MDNNSFVGKVDFIAEKPSDEELDQLFMWLDKRRQEDERIEAAFDILWENRDLPEGVKRFALEWFKWGYHLRDSYSKG